MGTVERSLDELVRASERGGASVPPLTKRFWMIEMPAPEKTGGFPPHLVLYRRRSTNSPTVIYDELEIWNRVGTEFKP